MQGIIAVAALVLAAFALHQYRANRLRGRMYACLAIALGLTYAHEVSRISAFKWTSILFLALALLFLAQGRKRTTPE